MRPSKALLYWLGGWFLLALVIAVLRPWLAEDEGQKLATAWWVLGLVLLIVAIVDGLRHRASKKVLVRRELPGSFSLGAPNHVTLRIDNPLGIPLQLALFDRYPPQVKVDAFPFIMTIPPNSFGECQYQALPVRRGDVSFGATELRILSPWKLWSMSIARGEPATVKIYPNFANISTLLQLQHEQQVNQLGIHVQQRRGEGINFHQLREYRKGDSLSQIDWKATARHVKLISREYEDERDQDIIFLLDCGRRMRTLDGDLSHFDHALNALLLTAYIALKQGDAVGLLSFAGDTRWIPPLKGPSAINQLLNRVYDLHSTTNASDLIQAAEHLLVKHRKRALVIIVSNIREEDHADLRIATRTLARRHLVMVASMREEFLDEAISTPVSNFESAIRYSGAMQFMEQRKRVLASLMGSGVMVIDSLARHFHSELANQYLNLKRSGRL